MLLINGDDKPKDMTPGCLRTGQWAKITETGRDLSPHMGAPCYRNGDDLLIFGDRVPVKILSGCRNENYIRVRPLPNGTTLTIEGND